MTTAPRARSSEIVSDGAQRKLPGNALAALPGDRLAAGEVVPSTTLAVNAAAQNHWVAPYDCEITGGVFRVTTQQTTANGSVDINKNGSSIGSVTVATTATAGTLLDVTVGAASTITAANAKLNRGDLITFSRPNTGAAGVVVGSLFIVPRQ